MSRTIRRKHVRDHNYWYYRDTEKRLIFWSESIGTNLARERNRFANRHGISERHPDLGIIAIKKHYHSDSYSPMNNPSWWIKEHDHIPRRRQERDYCRKILLLEDLEEAPLLCGHRIPYYW